MNKKTVDGILVRTSTGSIAIPDSILLRQFNDPASITKYEILGLLEGFSFGQAGG